MSIELDEYIGRQLRRRRRVLGMTQKQLADACGVRFQQIQKYECAANRMSAGQLWRLANALGVPPGYFYEGYEMLATSRPADPSAAGPGIATG